MDMRLHCGTRQDYLVRAQQFSKEITEPGHGRREAWEGIAGEATARLKDAVVDSRAAKQNDVSLQWVLLTTSSELELHLSVCYFYP